MQFESADTKSVLLRLDFLADGTMSANRGVPFGNVPRNQGFVLSVMLNIGSAAATAEIGIVSGGDGSQTVDLQPPFDELAQRFGAIRFHVAAQNRARFFITEALVTRATP